MQRLWIQSLVFMVLVSTLILTGCSRKTDGSKQTNPSGAMVTVKGSDTMVHLVSDWAEAFMKTDPGIQISVTGGGSGTGIAALMNGTTDVAASSRDLSDKEKKMADQKGLGLKETTVGMDGLSIVTNPGNPVKALSMTQLKDIFTGKVTNWKEVGGADMKILPYSRESSSGTYAFFQEYVLEKNDFAKTTRLMPASSGIIEAVASDEGGIGYVGLGYATQAKNKIQMLGVKADEKGEAVMPTETTIKDKSYPIARELFLITPGKASENAQKFVTYATSKEGQAIVQQSGYIPVQQQ